MTSVAVDSALSRPPAQQLFNWGNPSLQQTQSTWPYISDQTTFYDPMVGSTNNLLAPRLPNDPWTSNVSLNNKPGSWHGALPLV